MATYQHENHFTLDEARSLLEWLRPKVENITRLFRELTSRGFDPLQGRWEKSGNGHPDHPPPDEYNEFISLIAELDRRGVLIKEFGEGVVDFPHLLPNGKEVYLCWMLGEPTVSFWHRIPDGFMGRVPIEESKPRDQTP